MSVSTHPKLWPRIPQDGLLGREGKAFHAHQDLVTAANLALTLGRPLLLTGDAGCGKTDFAFAVERALRSPDYPDDDLLECHVRSDSRATDLLYRYDALTRFGDAHHGGPEGAKRAAEARNYIDLLPLGRALVAERLRVVLIDEIDKAPRDLPNDLLRELDHARFEIREIPEGAGPHPSGLERTMGRAPGDASRPFVLVTSNVERQLPDAFLRRCAFFHIRFPQKDELRRILVDRFGERRLAIDDVLRVFEGLRKVDKITKAPATAELIDWCRSLVEVYDPAQAASEVARCAAVLAGRPNDPENAPWKSLPGLPCLLKLREDLERVGVAA